MCKQVTGWLIVSICLLWGIVRALDLVEPHFLGNFFAIGGFCFGIYLTKNKEDEV